MKTENEQSAWQAEALEVDLLRAKLKRAEPLADALRFFLSGLDNGDLVRDITKDHRPDWALKMMHFVRDLTKAQQALAQWEAAQ